MPLTFVYTLVSVLLVSSLALIGIFFLSVREETLRKMIFVFVSLAVGALLGDVFIHLIPEAFASGDSATISLLIIAGFLFFFVFEKLLHWHRGHEDEASEFHGVHDHPASIHPTGYIVLFSDGVHNFIDGIIIGVAFLASTHIGIATTIAIILHEIPQEIGDFGVLLHSGFRRGQALWFNFLSGILAVVGALTALIFGQSAETAIVWILPLAAGGFLYIAASDLTPELQKTKILHHSLIQLFVIAIGVASMLLLTFLE